MKEMYAALMDLEKEYRKVCREEMWRVLNECEVGGYLIRSMSVYMTGVDYV